MSFKRIIYMLAIAAVVNFAFTACAKENPGSREQEKPQAARQSQDPAPAKLSYEIVRSFPHDTSCYTQGLIYHNGFLYESGGQYLRSSLRKVDPKTGKVLLKKSVPAAYFAEGIERIGNKIYMLTWREKKCLVYNMSDFSFVDSYDYTGEGWGMTLIDGKLVMSDGSNFLRIMDPDGFKPVKTIGVYSKGMPVYELNELEYDGKNIWANIYMSDDIALINPEDGTLAGLIDFNGLRAKLPFSPKTEVLNGIAHVPESDTYIVTGKYWPLYYEIKIKKQ